MARSTLQEAAIFLLVVTDHLRLSDRPAGAVPLSEVQQQAALWAGRPRETTLRNAGRRSRERFLFHATHFLRFLGRPQLPREPRPYADQISAFGDFLDRERGSSLRTCQVYCQNAERLLNDLHLAGHSLPGLTITQIDEA